jgi:hypothetical protein
MPGQVEPLRPDPGAQNSLKEDDFRGEVEAALSRTQTYFT